MATNGSYTAAPSPTAHHLALSSSISSLSSPRHLASSSSSSHVSKTYRQASTLFLTRRLPEALSTVQPLITPPPPVTEEDANGTGTRTRARAEPAPVARALRTTRVKVWSLYLTVLNAILEMEPDEGKEAFGSQEWRAICTKVRDGDVWEEVVRNGYHGVEGNVDSEVVINLATLLLAHARNQTLNQKRLENYLAAANTPNLDDISDRLSTNPAAPRSRSKPARSGADTPRDLAARVKILELYTLHVLARNGEWACARDCIAASPVLDEERREAFLLALQSLQDEQDETARREREERVRREDQLRRELDEARRLRGENEARERRRLEEERAARRQGSEVDYGVEERPRTPSTAGGSRKSGSGGNSRQALNGRGQARSDETTPRALPPISKPGKSTAAATPSFGTRAAVVLSNLRVLAERMSAALQANPALLIRTITFIVGLLLMFSRKGIRERISRIMGTSWEKVKATAGMGVKVSYI